MPITNPARRAHAFQQRLLGPPRQSISSTNSSNSRSLGSPIHANVTTGATHALNHPASSCMSATFAGKIIQQGNVPQTRHLYHNVKNDFPTTYPLSNVNIEKLAFFSKNHPDCRLVEYVLRGLSEGFDIGFRGINAPTRPKNLLSAKENNQELTKAVCKELERGHTVGPYVTPPFPDLHCSPIGAVTKKDGSCRIIMDLSQPKGQSINECIDKEEFTVHYTHFDRATDLVLAAGKGCLLSKADIKHAFRLLPVKPEDWKLLGYYWEGYYFIDVRLSFGGRSSPGIFNRFADLVCWVLQNVYHLLSTVHYSDDFFLVSGAIMDNAKCDLNTLRTAFQTLNIPIAPDKLVGPTTVITYLGIEINSVDMTIGIPDEKYSELMHIIQTWLNRKKCLKRELLSLVGKLSFVSKVVRPGRTFVRRLIELSTKAKELNHHIYINREAQEDIKWWGDFLPQMKSRTLIPDSRNILSTDLRLYTDASFKGFGAIFGKAWIQHAWTPLEEGLSIDFYELFAITAAVFTWGNAWEGKRIVFITDNLPITCIWHSGTSKATNLMILIRKMYLFAAVKGFSIALKHIPGSTNSIADAISRFQDHRFRWNC